MSQLEYSLQLLSINTGWFPWEIYDVFSLRNEVVHLLFTPHFFVWFVK
jgi:hypothetical protein